ncbi:hypothetical protein [Ottowia sp.]|uniref:hypothetical protein n=1 Tax=Ottowia sp. TaxID=1898956 RepID=UPI002B73C869|nr:hypothetical protein [Ottowia sp.]HNR84839.1 hypothetical protein [Ottowia sp.]
MPAVHDSSVEWQTSQAGQPETDPHNQQNELNDISGRRMAFSLIQSRGDALALTDEQVASAWADLDETDSKSSVIVPQH